MGDAPDSFAVDGKRRKAWNVGARHYGEHWVSGDVMGVCVCVCVCVCVQLLICSFECRKFFIEA